MRTAIRRPKINKPTKGMKTHLRQGLKAVKRAIALAAGPTRPDQWWHTSRQVRSMWLGRFNTSKYKPHQGAQEKARRVRQLAQGIISP